MTYPDYYSSSEGDNEIKSYPAGDILIGKERVLLVDDEPEIANMGKLLLEHFGYTVIAETSSHKALNHFQASPDDYDVIVTDYMMPDLSGGQLAGRIRALRSDIPIIMCTGMGCEEEISPQVTESIDCVLVKPFLMTDLVLTIRRALDQKEIENISEQPLF